MKKGNAEHHPWFVTLICKKWTLKERTLGFTWR